MTAKNEALTVPLRDAQPLRRSTGTEAMERMEGGQQRLRLVATAADRPPRLLELLSKYEDYLIGEQRRPQGRARYLWAMGRFIGWLGEESTHAELHAAAVQLYKEHLGKRGCASSTVINALAVIKDFSLWGIFLGLRADDPTAGIRRPPKKEPKPNPLYPDEVATLMAAIEYSPPPEGSRARWYWRRNRLAVILFLSTGLRLSEMAALLWSDIHLRGGVIDVRAEAAKNGTERSVPTTPSLTVELEAVPLSKRKGPVLCQINGKGLKGKSLDHIFRQWLPERLLAYSEATGIDTAMHIYAHRMRHTFGSMLVWEDVDLRTVQELLGHKQLETTAHYTKTDLRRKHAAVSRLPDFVQLGQQQVEGKIDGAT